MLRGITYHTSKNGGVLPPRRAKERARFQADFAVTAKDPQWQCVLKSTPSLELAIVLLDSPHAHTRRLQTFAILVNRNPWQDFNICDLVTEIPDRILLCDALADVVARARAKR
jgi:hypothetical protein